MLIIPISFVTDHIETLHEINIEAREEAEKLGVKEFVMTDGLNDSPQLIRALADLVLKAVSIEQGTDSTVAIRRRRPRRLIAPHASAISAAKFSFHFSNSPLTQNPPQTIKRVQFV